MDGNTVELRDLIKPLRRWWWLLLLSTLLATVSSFFYVRQQPPVYRATTTLMVGNELWKPNPQGGELYLAEQLARRYADMAMRRPIQEATMRALETGQLPNYRARVVPNTQLLEITVVDPNPERAQLFANELARQLIALNPNTSADDAERAAFVEEQLDQLQRAIRETQAQIEQKQAELSEVYSAREIARLDEEIQTLQRHLNNLRGLYADLYANTTEGAVNTLSVLEPAPLPTRPIQEFGWSMVLLAGAVGLMLAAGAAYGMEYLNDTIAEPDQVERFLNLPLLGSVPKLRKLSIEKLLAADNSDYAFFDEAYWRVCTNLLHRFRKHGIVSVLVTSTVPNEGKTLTSIQLALMLANTGRRVVLVDTDLRNPQLHELLGLSNEVGVADFLADPRVQVEDLLQKFGSSELYVMTAGEIDASHIPTLLESHHIPTLLSSLRALGVETVLMDSAPVGVVSDTVGLAMFVDAVVYVVEAGVTRRQEIRRALRQLQNMDAFVLGTVLNKVPRVDSQLIYSYYYRRLLPSQARRPLLKEDVPMD